MSEISGVESGLRFGEAALQRARRGDGKQKNEKQNGASPGPSPQFPHASAPRAIQPGDTRPAHVRP
jgi:hypothetical protein